jgi:hypothetical protein
MSMKHLRIPPQLISLDFCVLAVYGFTRSLLAWHYRVMNTQFTSGWGFSEIHYLFWIFPPRGSCGVMYRYTYRSGDFDTVITTVIWIHIWVLHTRTYPPGDPGQELVPRLRKGYSQGRAISNRRWAPREGESQWRVVPRAVSPKGV